MERLYALRGAIGVEDNEREQILAATDELIREVMARNALEPQAFVSCIFTMTDDLDAEFPAVAAREMGLSRVPLLCAREIPVRGAMASVVRVLIHCYPRGEAEPEHVYLGEARRLRLDLRGAQ